jgi:hypothetical protein
MDRVRWMVGKIRYTVQQAAKTDPGLSRRFEEVEHGAGQAKPAGLDMQRRRWGRSQGVYGGLTMPQRPPTSSGWLQRSR